MHRHAVSMVGVLTNPAPLLPQPSTPTNPAGPYAYVKGGPLHGIDQLLPEPGSHPAVQTDLGPSLVVVIALRRPTEAEQRETVAQGSRRREPQSHQRRQRRRRGRFVGGSSGQIHPHSMHTVGSFLDTGGELRAS
ncbi:hypothetical protein GCM10027614_41160 [Micromonospora vulcania]